MGEYKTPGVYIKEKSAFGNSVVEAETAIPAFIGYTEIAQNGNDNLTNKPFKISSMTEFLKYFGGAPMLDMKVDLNAYHLGATKDDLGKLTENDSKKIIFRPSDVLYEEIIKDKNDVFSCKDTEPLPEKSFIRRTSLFVIGQSLYTLYWNMVMFFANGGSICYVVSVGRYSKGNPLIEADKLIKGIKPLELVSEITMVVIPEAVNIASADQFNNVQIAMLQHCGDTMKDRFAIFDIYPKKEDATTTEEQMDVFRNGIGSVFLSYGAAYFPWLNTSVLSERDLNSNMFTWNESVYRNIKLISTDSIFINIVNSYFKISDKIELTDSHKSETINNQTFNLSDTIKNGEKIENEKVLYTITDHKEKKEGETIKKQSFTVTWPAPILTDKDGLYSALSNSSPMFKQTIKGFLAKLNLLPPSAAMAGIYAMVDKTRGVWKAPANVTLSYVNSAVEDIDDDQQANLNAPMNGKAINVIRTFRGEGVKVWGARTLDGNSLDWRYINVRRTLLFLEESVKNAARAYVFEPNVAGTWINMKCMIENFLRSVWKRGGLAGATPEDAYEVHVGLGDTMTGNDILEGIMRITVLVAVSHPAEFIEITFQQQVQKS